MKDDPIETIRSLGEKYFPQLEFLTFLDEIKRLAPKPSSEFFQLLQQGNDLHLEYAAISGPALIDITLKPSGMNIITVKLSTVCGVQFEIEKQQEGSGARIDVIVRTVGSQGLRYSATSKESALRLKNYAVALQRIVVEAP